MALCRAALCSVVPLGCFSAVCGWSPPQAWRCVVLPCVVLCPRGALCGVRLEPAASMALCRAALCSVVPRGALCGVWREPAASMTLCRAALCSVVPSGCLVRCAAGARRKHDVVSCCLV
jgi:hypothetical protein